MKHSFTPTQKHIWVSLTLVLITVILQLWSCQKNPDDEPPAQPVNIRHTCYLDAFPADDRHTDQLKFARLLAYGVGHSPLLKQAVYAASLSDNPNLFQEILVADFLGDSPLGNNLAKTILKKMYEHSEEAGDFTAFIKGLLERDPLLVIKIPDWFASSGKDFQTSNISVFVNYRGDDGYFHGFDGFERCISKSSMLNFSTIEMVIKTSEDYILIQDEKFIEPYAQFCMSAPEFFQKHTRPFGDYHLLKKRDMQRLWLCPETTTTAGTTPQQEDCQRATGIDHNYLRGFQLADPDIALTFNNQDCSDGEETFDFQVDLLYAFRTTEASAAEQQLPPLPLFGIRLAELVDFDVRFKQAWPVVNFSKTKYYALVAPADGYGFNYLAQINPGTNEWIRDDIGETMFIYWNETDFNTCENTPVNPNGITSFSYISTFKFRGKSDVPNASYNTNLSEVTSHTIYVNGYDVIPLGYSALGYCEQPAPGTPPAIWHPTGPQGLNVHFDYLMEQ